MILRRNYGRNIEKLSRNIWNKNKGKNKISMGRINNLPKRFWVRIEIIYFWRRLSKKEPNFNMIKRNYKKKSYKN